MKKIRCLSCKKEFYTKTAFNAHMITKHNVKWEEYKKDKTINIFEEFNNEADPQTPLVEDTNDFEFPQEIPIGIEVGDDVKDNKVILMPIEQKVNYPEVKPMSMLNKLKEGFHKGMNKPVEKQMTVSEILGVVEEKQPTQELILRCIIADAKHQQKLNEILTEFVCDGGITVKEFTWKTYDPETKQREETFSKLDKEKLSQGLLY